MAAKSKRQQMVDMAVLAPLDWVDERTGANASISRYPWSVPGTHVDGVEAWLYPIVPSQVTG